MKTGNLIRSAAVLLGAALLVSAGAAVASADESYGDDDVDVTVDIAAIEEPGVLALTVASGSTSLAENGSTELVRQFTGTLPTVTVTDTRTADEIPGGAAWYVLGTATDFVGDAGQPDIGAENLGWTPGLVDYDGSGEVFAGEPVDGAEQGGPGLVDQELLFATIDSGSVAPEGAWSATADLVLRTGAAVTAGSYSSTITLSLFE